MFSRVLQLIGLCGLCTFLAAAEGGAQPSAPATSNAPVEIAKPAATPAPATTAPAPKLEQPKLVYVIPVHGQIGSAVHFVVRRGVKEALAQNADAVILDLKTPGGSLGATFEIMEALTKFERPTFTFVNNEAISAGAFIAATTHEIWFAPDGIIGAAAPVLTGGQDVEATMKLKIVSYLKARVRAMSEGKGYRGEVISAMIDADRELKIDGKVIKEKGELLSLTAAEAAKAYGDPARPLLSAGTAKSLHDLLQQRFPDAKPKITRLEMTWSESLAAWLNSISPILLGIGMLALFIEFKTPGFGVFGVIGICALGAVFLSNYIAGLSGHEPILFFGLGLLLLAIELFFFPGIFVLAVAGLVLILGSLVWSMADLWPDEPLSVAWSTDAFAEPLTNLGIGVLIAGALGLALLRYLPRGWVWDKLVVGATIDGAAQLAGGGIPAASTLASLVGRQGVAATALHPSGQVEVDGQRYEARVEVGAVERGRPVVVRASSDFGLIVEEIP